ncbi:MAG: M1 family metallopeptidase [Gemmatimonadota bacterium]|nr:M1 family metallopeptidase [Gemmatimonadota bacterium]
MIVIRTLERATRAAGSATRFVGALVAVLALAGPADAQTGDGPVDPRFATPQLPTPNVWRAASGRPGPEYWQQRVDYDIEATLDPATQTITGSETITYFNRSPDTLRYVWFQLDQNLFAPGSQGAQTHPQGGRFGGSAPEGGYTIARVAGPAGTLDHRIDDTRMRVELAEPVAPGASTTLEVDWSFVVPITGADRMGRDGDHYVIAQWYPRLAVYDDVHGWNTMPYLGQGEFYLEYGDFDVALTVPAAYLVGATGALENPDEVLTATQRERIEKARSGDEVVAVVSADELSDKAAIRPKAEGTLTWRFRAEDVRDVAWAASPEAVWDATTSGDGTLIHALYRPEAKAWREAAEMSRHSIDLYSEMLIDYPYPTATAVEGPVYGMEYPMIVFVAPESSRESLFDVLDHEWAHMWFPMIVGTDERRHAWMDEGLVTFLGQFSKAEYFPESEPFLLTVAQYAQAVRAFEEQPVGTVPDRFTEPQLYIGAYVKPAVMLNALRALAGAEAFDAAFAAYTKAWAYRHPQPADFFRFMENELGTPLGTFWHDWIHTTATSDVAILGQDQNRVGEQWEVVVTVDQRGEMILPARVVAATATGVTDTVTIPAEAFYGSDRATATLYLPERAARITVNEGPMWGDLVPRNNVWTR